MFNWFKKKEIKVEWWSDVDALNDSNLDFLRPQKANKFFPEWFRTIRADVSTNIFDSGTIKKCPGFPELITQGYVVPLWSDVELYYDIVNGEEVWEWKTPTDAFKWDIHDKSQFLNYLPEDEQEKWGFSWKALCPWRVRTPRGYSMYQMPLWYHFNKFFVLPGSIRTDFHCEINQQVLVPSEWRGKRIVLERGTPFAWYIPYKRTTYTHEYVPFTEERKRLTESSTLNIRSKFSGGYKERVLREDRKQK